MKSGANAAHAQIGASTQVTIAGEDVGQQETAENRIAQVSQSSTEHKGLFGRSAEPQAGGAAQGQIMAQIMAMIAAAKAQGS